MSEQAVKNVGPMINFYINNGFLVKYDNGTELSKKNGFDDKILNRTFHLYSESAKIKRD